MDDSALPVTLTAGRALRQAGPGILTALAEDDGGAPYDRHARIYDRLVGTDWYNRVIWGTTPEAYTAFAEEAVDAGTGPLLDVCCGTAVFTGAVYRAATRPLVLVDRSVGMLGVAASRLGEAKQALLQADLFDLPFAPGQFDTVVSHAALHVLDEPWLALEALRDQLAPGGRAFISMLVSDRGRISSPYLRLLRRAGELGPIRSAAEFQAAARDTFSDDCTVERAGSMAYLRVTDTRPPLVAPSR